MLNQGKRIGGEPVHVGDSYVWAEIYYLDSATDYREYLPRKVVARPAVFEKDLVMLDSSRESLSSGLHGGLVIAGFFFVIAGLLLFLMLYWLA